MNIPPPGPDRLAAYAALVREWADRIDLVAPGDLDRFEDRHVADSLRLLPLLESLPPGPGVDVGSGAGLPGIPLAIAGPDREWRLIEPRAKRAGFLEEVVRAVGLRNCEVVTRTAQQAARDAYFRGAHAVAVARALAPPRDAFALLAPLVMDGGVAAVFAGGHAELPREAMAWAEGIAIVEAGDQGERE